MAKKIFCPVEYTWELWEGIKSLIEFANIHLHWHSTVVCLNYDEIKIQLVSLDRPADRVKQPQYVHIFKGAWTLARTNPQAVTWVIFKANTRLGTGQAGWLDQVVYIVRLAKFASYFWHAICYAMLPSNILHWQGRKKLVWETSMSIWLIL